MAKKSTARSKNALTGEAGVHFVASELYRRGMVALPTTGNVRGMDLVVVKRRGNKIDFRAMEVKTTLNEKPQGFWPLSRPGRAPVSPRLFYAFIRRSKSNDKESPQMLEAFVVSSLRVQKERTKATKNWPGSWYLPDSQAEQQALRNNWDSLWNS